MSDVMTVAKQRMEKAINHVNSNFATVRTGRANPNLLDHVEVDYYGSPTPIKQIASISVSEGRTLVIKPYDPTSLKNIEKAIQMADLGIAPTNDGSVVRLTMPLLTEETRKQLCKEVGKMAEEGKVQVRNVRRECNDMIKKDKELTEDDQKGMLDDIQKLTDSYIKQIETLQKEKEKDVMTV